MSTKQQLSRTPGGSTNFHSIFQRANKAYDRIIILSDQQGWVGYYTPKAAFAEYKKRYNCDPIIYSFDLNSYGTMQFPESKVYALAGWSDKVFDIMQLLETDRKAFINKVKSISFE